MVLIKVAIRPGSSTTYQKSIKKKSRSVPQYLINVPPGRIFSRNIFVSKTIVTVKVILLGSVFVDLRLPRF